MKDDGISGRWRIAGISAAAISFLLISALIHISTYDVDYGTRVWVHHTMLAGSDNAIRVALVPRKTSSAGIYPTNATITLVPVDKYKGQSGTIPDESALHIMDTNIGDLGLIEGVIRIPKNFPDGDYRLMLDIQTSDDSNERSSFPIRVISTSIEKQTVGLTVRPVCEESSGRRQDGGWHRARRCLQDNHSALLYPISGYLSAHNETSVHLWIPPSASALIDKDSKNASDKDSPELNDKDVRRLSIFQRDAKIIPLHPHSAGTVSLEPAAQAISAYLDDLGLGTFSYTPGFPRGSLRIEVGDLEEQIWLRDLSPPITIEPDNQLLKPGETFNVEISVAQPDRPILIEVWAGDQWISAHSGRVRGHSKRLGMPLPSDTFGFVMVRAGVGHYTESRAYTSAWIDSNPKTQAIQRLALALQSLPNAKPLATYSSSESFREPIIDFVAKLDPSTLEEINDSSARRAASAMLSRLEPANPAPPMLADNTGQKILAMERWQQRVRRPILAALGIIALVVVAVLVFSIVAQQRAQKKLFQRFRTNLDDEVSIGSKHNHGYVIASTIAIGIVLVGAIVGLLVFLETLRWTHGDLEYSREREAATAQTEELEERSKR